MGSGIACPVQAEKFAVIRLSGSLSLYCLRASLVLCKIATYDSKKALSKAALCYHELHIGVTPLVPISTCPILKVRWPGVMAALHVRWFTHFLL